MKPATAISPRTHAVHSVDLRALTYRDHFRNLAIDGLAAWDAWTQDTARLQAPVVHVLLLHHVFADEVDTFRRLLANVREHYQFIRYSDAVMRILENRIDHAYLAISFDDGLKCCRQAADVLDEFGAQACFFVCPAIVNETNPEVVARFCRERLRYPPVELLDWNDIERLVDRGHEIGGHTMRHVNLSEASLAAAQEEIGETHTALCARLGTATHFAWPYGRFADIRRDAVRAVFEAGFCSCASGVRGCHGPVNAPLFESPFSPERLCLRRESLAASWPLAHVNYFLHKSARRPLTIDETWSPALRLTSPTQRFDPCTLPSTLSQSSPAAA